MAKGRHIPPSRRRYEQSHPVVAIRVNEELYRKLKQIKNIAYVSFADIVRQGLGMQEAESKKAFYVGFDGGFYEGAIEGRKLDLGICAVCKKPLQWDLNQEEFRQLLEKTINDARMIHYGCRK